MDMSKSLVKDLEDAFVLGMHLHKLDAERTRKEIRENPEKYLRSLILSIKKASFEIGPSLSFILLKAKRDEQLLKEAEEMLQGDK